jgi:mRNA-degrading endonuclease RelE of RelBE toxin-antitoxin system
MSYSVQTIPTFRKEAKRLLKKYPSLKSELEQLGQLLAENPDFGTPLGNNCYKIRLQIASKNRGKSGGARVITHVYIENEIIYLLSIYDKSDKSTLSDSQIAALLSQID